MCKVAETKNSFSCVLNGFIQIFVCFVIDIMQLRWLSFTHSVSGQYINNAATTMATYQWSQLTHPSAPPRSWNTLMTSVTPRFFSTAKTPPRSGSPVDPVFKQAEKEGLLTDRKGKYDFRAIAVFLGTAAVFGYGGYCFVSSCHGRPQQTTISGKRDAPTGPKIATGEPVRLLNVFLFFPQVWYINFVQRVAS